MRKLIWLVFALTALAQQPTFVTEGIINAPITEVWKVFSTSEGYKALGPALAEVDLKIGGTIRSRYKADGKLGDEQTIENVILAYEPLRMIATRIQKPPKSFPFQKAWREPWTVVTLTEAGPGKTHLRATSLGYGTDEESVAMRKFFEHGNQETIEKLQAHFASRK
jgi:uncharacterized protein YndB with AHSA1/START domain